MAADLKSIMDLLEQIKANQDDIVAGRRIAPNQIDVRTLSEISKNLGLVQAGEFRGGNKKDLNHGFSGVRLTEDGLLVYSNDVVTGKIDADGDWFAGGDVSVPATTGFSIFSSAQTYNGESMGAGDVLLGDNSSGMPNVLWDASAAALLFRTGTNVKNRLSTASLYGSGARISRTTTQAITTASLTPVQFDREDYDDSGFVDLVSDNTKITVPAGYAGMYRIEVYVNFDSNATGYRRYQVSTNGTSTWVFAATSNAVNGTSTEFADGGVGGLAAGDYVQLHVYHTKGSDLNLLPSYMAISPER